MKVKIFVCLISVLSICVELYSTEDKTTVVSKIEEAKIFFNGAELTHRANAILIRGDNEIWITGLSPNIDKNSIKIKTTNGVIVSSFEFSMDYLSDKTIDPQIQKIKDEMEKQKKLLEQVETDIKINNKLLVILQKSTDKNIAGTDNGLSIDELIKTMEYYKTKSLEIEKNLASDKEKKEQLHKTIYNLKAQYDQESIKNNKISGILKLNLSSPVAVNCEFTISYYTYSAGWVPYYDINVESTDQPVKIITKAKIRQVTGIDWNKIKISLSTAVPSSGKVAPLFDAWFLRYRTNYGNALRENFEILSQNSYSYEESEVMQDISAIQSPQFNELQSKGLGASMLYIVDGIHVDEGFYNSLNRDIIKTIDIIDPIDAVNLYGPEGANGAVVINLKNSMNDFVAQSEDQLNITFEIDIPYSIPGNGKEQSLELNIQEVPAIFKYYSAPKLDTETYLLAEISGWQKLNLLSGNANITYDGTYVGETYINTTSTQENLSLTLGTDKRVVVKREKQKDYSSTKVFGSDVKQEFSYLLTVRNNQNRDIRMVLKDQYPISTTKEITVELNKEIVKPTFNVENVGVVTWEFDMKPGETKTFKMVYSVKYPKGKELDF